MSVHVYPRCASFVDLARATVGATLSGTPLVFASTPPALEAVSMAFVSVFLALAYRATLHLFTRLEMDQDGLCGRMPRPIRLDWSTLQRVDLAYYSTRRDRSGGWLQLTLSGDGRRLAVDSKLDGFAGIAERAAAAACKNRLSLASTTRANFLALGIDPGPGQQADVGR